MKARSSVRKEVEGHLRTGVVRSGEGRAKEYSERQMEWGRDLWDKLET